MQPANSTSTSGKTGDAAPSVICQCAPTGDGAPHARAVLLSDVSDNTSDNIDETLHHSSTLRGSRSACGSSASRTLSVPCH